MADHPLHAPVLAWYAVGARDLPWRDPECSPWGVLVSEVMLQQTPVARVLPAWQRWIERWPTPASLAADAVGEAIRAWDRLGYPRRAVRLHEAATAIVARHRGEVPDDLEQLLALPGIGSYTAAAVASFAFRQRHAVVDTNVRRVLARTVTGLAQAAPSLTAAERTLAEELVPEDAERAATWAVASMELGALICTARAPRCADCPVIGLCRWQADGAPAYDGPPRRGQRYQGTDRYVRGLLLAALRAAHDRRDSGAIDGSLTQRALLDAVPDDALRDGVLDPHQRERCLDSLVADGLVEPLPRNRFRLPGR
ncbi:MAG: A/G-specific adenine glycosylase [Kineosporiaceae bacterium]